MKHFFNDIKLLFFITIFLSCFTLSAQNKKANLQSQYNNLLNEIKNIESLIDETKSKKQESLHQLQSIFQKISYRESLINNIQSQVQYLQNNINEKSKVIESLKQDIEDLKASYAQIIYHSYKNLKDKNRFTFIFSASNFNQAIQRFSYLRAYSKYRKQQANLIQQTLVDLAMQLETLEAEKKVKEGLLKEEQAQSQQLLSEKKSKDSLVKKLQQDEASLKKQIQEKNKAAQKLNNEIQKIIEEEIRLATEKAKKEAAKKGTEVLKLTPEEQLLSDNFVSNKGKLPWPVLKGHIIEQFGTHPHPTLKDVKINNNGIDIKTEKEADVRVIFNGIVVSAFYLPTTQNSVIIKHGEYFSVYSHLKSVNVKAGDNLTVKQNIGKAYTNSDDNVTKIHLEIWKGTQKTNPELWISK